MESSSLVFDPQAGIKKYFGAYINIIIVKRTYDISISFFCTHFNFVYELQI